MENQDVSNEIKHQCRCCMKDEVKSDMIDLFDKNFIVEIFRECTLLEVAENDSLPNTICSLCHQKLIDTKEFQSMCRNSDQMLRENVYSKYEGKLLKSSSAFIKMEQFDSPLQLNDINKTESLYSETLVETEIKSESSFENILGSNDSNMVIIHSNDESSGNIKSEHNDSIHQVIDLDDDSSDSDYRANDTITSETDNQIDDIINNPVKKKLKRKRSSNKDKKGSTIYPCTLCNKKFYRERRLEGHLRTHQGLKPAVCHICKKEFSKWGGLDAHILYTHNAQGKEFMCDEPNCGRAYMMKQGLTTHKRRVHSDAPKPKNNTAFICEQCGKSFTSNATLKKHTFIHTGLRPFKCTLCPKKYITNHKLKEHMMRHEGIKNYVCPQCGMKKTTLHELNVHINYHTKEKQYQCKLCPRIFSSPGNRGRHYKIVHCGIKAYNCTHCDKSFGKAETLKHHVMTHTGEKPHGCKVCGRRFIQLVALQTHMKTHNKPS